MANYGRALLEHTLLGMRNGFRNERRLATASLRTKAMLEGSPMNEIVDRYASILGDGALAAAGESISSGGRSREYLDDLPLLRVWSIDPLLYLHRSVPKFASVSKRAPSSSSSSSSASEVKPEKRYVGRALSLCLERLTYDPELAKLFPQVRRRYP
jgi:hypothetical protein